MFLKANIPLSASKFASYFGNFSIKHDRVILVNMEISVILGHEKTKIQNIID